MQTRTQEGIVPAISSDTAGPLGAIHLPRLWLKLTLASAGRLADGYDECGTGFDAMTLSALGLDREKTIDFVRREKPTYMEFERWVVRNGKTDHATIERHNAAIRGYDHPADKATKMRQASTIEDASVLDAVTLNTVEDLDELYNQVSG
jgi:hypothetical protein